MDKEEEMRRNIYRHRWLFLVGGLPLHLPVAGLGPQDLWSVLGGSFGVPFSFARCVASFFGAIDSTPSYDGLRFLTGDGDCFLSQLTYSSQAHARRFTHTSPSKVQYSKPVRLQQHFGVFVSLPCCVLCRICSADYCVQWSVSLFLFSPLHKLCFIIYFFHYPTLYNLGIP